jgi:deoxyribodipyrimidine photo-lyase
MPDTAIVWFRRDLRVDDLPALAHACREHERIVPLFVLDPGLLRGRFRSPGRTAWLLECLAALDGELRARGARLAVRHGRPETEVRRVAREAGAATVHVSDDVTGFARSRDARVEAALGRDGVALRRHPGLYVADLPQIATAQGGPYKVFTPFLRAWRAQARRVPERAPRTITTAPVAVGELPSLRALGFEGRAPRLQDRPEPGPVAARSAAGRWLRSAALERYAERRDVLAVPTSRLSAPPALRLPVGAVARAPGGHARSAALPRPARVARLPRRRTAALPGERARRAGRALPHAGMGSRPRSR